MKKFTSIYLLGAGLLLGHDLAFAQTRTLTGVESQNVVLKEDTGSLQLEMTLKIGDLDLGKKEKMTVTPRLLGEDGKSYDFKPFVVAGRMRQRIDSRAALLSKQALPTYYSEYVYREQIPFALWMEKAQLVLDGRMTACSGAARGDYARVVADSVQLEPKLPAQRYVMRPVGDFTTPEPEPIKNRAEAGSAKIEFMSGKSAILPNYRGNEAELRKIGTAIRQIMTDSLMTINSMLLTAYSSPDGSYASNDRLSQARALALKNYLDVTYDFKTIPTTTQAVAEDWAGLEKLISQSELPNKDQLLAAIANNPDPDRRERAIRAINAGRTWQTMMRDWFPQLRRTDYRIDYSVKSFTVEQGRQLIKSRPGQMSLNEMFHVANSYPQGSEEFNEVFDIAVRMFPQDAVANLNAAAIAVNKADSTSAWKYLQRVQDDTRAYNNMAAYYLLVNDIEKAKEYLEKAPQQVEEVQKNLEEINRKEQDNALFDKYEKYHGKNE